MLRSEPTVTGATELAMNAPLSHWLRLLWGRAPMLHLDSDAPFIAAGELHLPARSHWQDHCAAAAHAAAHLAYSPGPFDGRGLVPIARVLLALLEDARVEALAARELPGLARLWRGLHTATPDDGAGLEALLRRLARALADPDYDDPHPWVGKGRRLLYLDARLGALALRTPQELRTAATRLGHDIGQMRLAFNAKAYRPAPDYRDDHRWMWPAENLAAAEPPLPRLADGGPPPADSPLDMPDMSECATVYPEWDRLIGRLRPDWCSVQQSVVPGAATVDGALDAASLRLAGCLRGSVRSLVRPTGLRGRSAQGDMLAVDALVDWRLAQRLRRGGEMLPYRSPVRCAADAAVWVLVDQSASTAAPGPGGRPVLAAAADAALAIALALQRHGIECTVAGFSSQGRHAVRLVLAKRREWPADAALRSRLRRLRSGGSTRVGAALRHATAQLGARHKAQRCVLLLSDGQPHDIDVHDPHYLVADARQAVQEAMRRSVRTVCVALGSDRKALASAAGIFGRRAMQPLESLSHLPRVLRHLLA